MSADSWLSPVQIVDSRILGLNLSVADGFAGGETHFFLTMNSSVAAPSVIEGSYVCRCSLEAVGEWSVDKEGTVPAFSASCKLGITIAVPEGALERVPEGSRDRFVAANAVSIAYGKIRSMVEGMTSESIVGRQTIPAIDPYAFIDSVAQRQGQGDSET